MTSSKLFFLYWSRSLYDWLPVCPANCLPIAVRQSVKNSLFVVLLSVMPSVRHALCHTLSPFVTQLLSLCLSVGSIPVKGHSVFCLRGSKTISSRHLGGIDHLQDVMKTHCLIFLAGVKRLTPATGEPLWCHI